MGCAYLFKMATSVISSRLSGTYPVSAHGYHVIHRSEPVNDVTVLEWTTPVCVKVTRYLQVLLKYVGEFPGRGRAGRRAGGTCLWAGLVWYLNDSIVWILLKP